MYKINPLLESTVARRLVDQGIITDPKKIKMMIRKGWIPTKKRTVRGLRRSATNVAKKLGYKPITRGNTAVNSFSVPHIQNKKFANVVIGQASDQARAFGDTVAHKFKPGDMFIPHDPSRYTYKKAASKTLTANPLQSAVISWHEGREAARQSSKLGKRMMDKSREFTTRFNNPETERKLSKFVVGSEKHNNFLKKMQNAQSMGGHYPGVMRDEAKLDNMIRRRYGVGFQDNIIGRIKRTPKEKELGRLTAKQDFKTRSAVYDDLVNYINSLK